MQGMFFGRGKQVRAGVVRWPDILAYRRYCELNSELSLLTEAPSRNDSLIVFAAVKNEADILPTFLDHYRLLGVDRFVIVDNNSDDGTREALEAEKDVSLYFSKQEFSAALAGRQWTDFLAYRHALGKWAIFADADELLIYDDHERRPLPDLIAVLKNHGSKRLFAPLVDLYESNGELYFDAAPEVTRRHRTGTHVEGGPRLRMALRHGAARGPFLTKYPLSCYDEQTCYSSLHLPFPRDRNNPYCFARLLHLKLTSRFQQKISEALDHKQYFQQSADYAAYARWAGSDLRETFSRPYAGPKSLIACGLMDPVPWDGAKLRPYKWKNSLRA